MAEAEAIVPFLMPSLGADMEEGKLVEWLIAPGQHVAHGDIVAVVETVKGAVEIEIFEDGVVERLIASLGETLPVGAPIAEIRVEAGASSGAEAASPATDAVPAPADTAPPTQAPPVPSPQPSAAPGRVSPAARRLANEHGVDLSAIAGTGPGGAIRLEDVEASLKAAPPAPEDPLEAMRQAIGQSMARSKREIPHYYLGHTIDVTPALDWLTAQNEAREPDRRILLGALIVKAVARAAKAHPRVNGHYDGTFKAAPEVHVGVAVALRGGGLTAPAIHRTDLLTLDEVMAAMRDLIGRARAGRLRATEMSDPTITVSSIGDRGVEAMSAIINPPQVAMVAFGAPLVRPWVLDGAVVPRTLVSITLSADHRVSDGRIGSRFLMDVERHLAKPEEL